MFLESNQQNNPATLESDQANIQLHDSDDDNLGNNYAPNMVEVTSTLSDLEVDNKENQIEKKQQDQSNTTKKWYEGTVIRPVAFRALKRLDQN